MHTLSVEDVVSNCLTFDDVLLVPRHAKNVQSRLDPDLSSYLGGVFLENPFISANMSTITELNMMVAMDSCGCLGILHRFLSIDEQCNIVKTAVTSGVTHRNAVSLGVTQGFMSDATALYEAGARVFCVDVAHGDSAKVVNVIKTLRKELPPGITIIGGNVATGSGAARLAEAGASVVKVGVGPGCFTKGTLIRTENGLKSIENITVGEKVYTHKNRLQNVTKTFTHHNKNDLIIVNGIESTPNHEYYVLHKSKLNSVSDSNIHELAEWISAVQLTKDYMLLKLKF